MSGENEISLAEAIERARQHGLAEGNSYECTESKLRETARCISGSSP
jgi:hypothetical protein